MTADPLTRLVDSLRTTLDTDQESDASLLNRVRRRRDPGAVEAIVRRHGTKVLAACRKVLGPSIDADDAFQATFLVLLRNPSAIRRQESLGAWLYGVAHRIALQARKRHKRRQQSINEVATSASDLSWTEACAILHEELDRLPNSTRLPLVLCYLDGLSRDEAAMQLGRTLNSIKKSLEKGRELLRKRLTKRGVTLSAGLLAAVAEPVAGEVSPELVRKTVEGIIRPDQAIMALAHTATGKLFVRVLAVGLAASVLVVGAVLGFPKTPPEQPPTKNARDQPVAKNDEPKDSSKGERITFVGTVVDPKGKPVKGAKIYLLRWGENSYQKVGVSAKVTTDSDGRFRFAVSASDYPESWWSLRPQLVATAGGFGLAMFSVDGAGVANATLKLIEDLPISGRVLNLEGKPVQGVKVRAINVAAGVGDDLSAWLKNAEAKGVNEMSLVFEHDLPRHIGNTRSPIPGVPGATTDENGRFKLFGVGRERVVTLSIEGEAIATARLTVLTQQGNSGSFPPSRLMPRARRSTYYRPPFEYVAAPTQPFEGRVTDLETGEPIAGVKVTQWWSEAITDKDGQYRLIGLKAGRTSIDFRPGSELPYFTRSALGGTKDSIQTATVDIALKRGVWIHGKVVDERTKLPISRARIYYRVDRDNKHFAEYFEKGRSPDVETQTGKDGTFRIAGIPGKGWLFVDRDEQGLSAAERPLQGDTNHTDPPEKVLTSDGEWSPDIFQAIAVVDVSPSKLKRYTITVDPGTEVPIRLVDPQEKPVSKVIALGWEKYRFNWSKPFTSGDTAIPAFNSERPRVLFFYQPTRSLGLVLQPKKGDAGPWTIKLQPTATVTGRLVLPNGKPYPNASLSLSFKYPGRAGPSWPPRDLPESHAQTDANGKFTFTKIIGDLDYDFWYNVFGDKHNTSTTIPFRAKPGETKDLGTIKTQAPRE